MVIASSILQVGLCRGAEQTSPGYADEMTAWRLLAPRGSTTFTSIEDFPFNRYSKRGRVRAVGEVSVDYAIPDVAGLTTGLWRAEQDRWVPADPGA